MEVKWLPIIFLFLAFIARADYIDIDTILTNGTCQVVVSSPINITDSTFIVNDTGAYNNDSALYVWSALCGISSSYISPGTIFTNGSCFINSTDFINLENNIFIVNNSGVYLNDTELYDWKHDCMLPSTSSDSGYIVILLSVGAVAWLLYVPSRRKVKPNA